MIISFCRRSSPGDPGHFPMQKGFSYTEKLEKKRSRIGPVNLNTEKSANLEK